MLIHFVVLSFFFFPSSNLNLKTFWAFSLLHLTYCFFFNQKKKKSEKKMKREEFFLIENEQTKYSQTTG